MILKSDETIKKEAIERLNGVQEAKLGQKERAVCSAVRNALTDFCKQETEFAQAILDKDEGFDACLREVVKGCGNCLSDIEAYRRAVAFYFPGAGVNFTMRIDLCASVGGSEDQKAEIPVDRKNVLDLNISDLFF